MRHIMALLALVGMLGLGMVVRADGANRYVVQVGGTDVIKATIFVDHLAEVAFVGDGDTNLNL